MSSDEALNTVNLNTIDATPLRLHKFKRKQTEDDYTPKSRHIDKRLPQASVNTREEIQGSRKQVTSPVKDNAISDRSPVDDPISRSLKAGGSRDRADVFAIQEKEFDGSTSIGSVLSHPDFSASVVRDVNEDTEEVLSNGEHTPQRNTQNRAEESDDDNIVTSARASVRSMSQNSIGDPSDEDTPVRAKPHSAIPPSASPTRTPRLRDFLMPLNTPRSIVDSALRGRQSTATKETYPIFTEADLISFQTPAPKNHLDPQSRLRHFKTESGEEMLLDMTPRVYSPKSIPIYTLHDLDQIKAEFDQVKREFEARIQTLHEELATSVSNTNHHKALAAQGESLHAEYSKKHVRKVTALKTDWERKTVERLALKDAKIVEKDELISQLQKVLAQEREEKKEVIAMAEAVLALQQQG